LEIKGEIILRGKKLMRCNSLKKGRGVKEREKKTNISERGYRRKNLKNRRYTRASS